jgi:hypothetical protein
MQEADSVIEQHEATPALLLTNTNPLVDEADVGHTGDEVTAENEVAGTNDTWAEDAAPIQGDSYEASGSQLDEAPAAADALPVAVTGPPTAEEAVARAEAEAVMAAQTESLDAEQAQREAAEAAERAGHEAPADDVGASALLPLSGTLELPAVERGPRAARRDRRDGEHVRHPAHAAGRGEHSSGRYRR